MALCNLPALSSFSSQKQGTARGQRKASKGFKVENLKRMTHQLAWVHCVAEDGGGELQRFGVYLYTLILLRYQASQRWRP